MTWWGVLIYFEDVYDILGPFDRWLAELVCVDMASGVLRGERVVHVTRARIVAWIS